MSGVLGRTLQGVVKSSFFRTRVRHPVSVLPFLLHKGDLLIPDGTSQSVRECIPWVYSETCRREHSSSLPISCIRICHTWFSPFISSLSGLNVQDEGVLWAGGLSALPSILLLDRPVQIVLVVVPVLRVVGDVIPDALKRFSVLDDTVIERPLPSEFGMTRPANHLG